MLVKKISRGITMKLIKAILRRIIAFLKLVVLKLFYPTKLKFSPIEVISLTTRFNLEGQVVHLGKGVATRRNVEFNTYYEGTITIGDKCFFNNNCILASQMKIQIGDNCSFGPNVLIYDHDHDFRHKEGKKPGYYKKTPVIIGKNVWVGANCIILRGTNIGDNSVIAAGTIVKGNIPNNTMVYQKRELNLKQIDITK
jgi:acetyltransferase-like isoleucine patch superfamily enzyme